MTQSIKYYLGIDGGGTKTEFCLTDENGTHLCSALLGASNPNDIGLDATCALLSEGIDKVTDGYNRADISVFAGIAGAATGDHASRIKAHLDTLGFAKADAASDVRSCLAACFGDHDGIAVILGTGSVAFAQCGGQLLRAGGYAICSAMQAAALPWGKVRYWLPCRPRTAAVRLRCYVIWWRMRAARAMYLTHFPISTAAEKPRSRAMPR